MEKHQKLSLVLAIVTIFIVVDLYLPVSFSADEVNNIEYFVAINNGIVWDKKTDLEWMAGPDKDTDWYEAKRWVENLNVAGGGWRMPTRIELSTLYIKNAGSRNMTALLKTTGWYVWSGEAKDPLRAWDFNFYIGQVDWFFKDFSSWGRGFAVRSRN